MKSKKPLMAGGIMAGVVLAGLIGYSASAQSAPGSPLVDKIASRFNLNKSVVQKVFDDNRAEKIANQELKYETRLNQALKDGKLTLTQKGLIIAKHKELVASIKSWKGDLKHKTREERRAALEQKRSEIEAWEKQNNIPAGYLGFGRGHYGFDKKRHQ